MRMISKEALQALRERFPKGTRVELLQMDDPQAPPIGTKGTVRGVDDIGSIMVAWDNGCGLSVAWGEDECATLWDDLFSFAFPGDDYERFDSENDEYFLGPIVTFKNLSGQLEIIDGSSASPPSCCCSARSTTSSPT